MSCTYLNNDSSDERNLICRFYRDGDTDTSPYRGVLVSALSEEQITEKRREKFEKDKKDVREFPPVFREKLDSATSKDEWKQIYFEFIPFKVDINGNFIPEPVIDITKVDIFMVTVDEARLKYFDIYEHDEGKSEFFQYIKAAWNEAKEYIRTMADIIWAGKE